MPTVSKKRVSPLLVVIAFATVYLVWGSTYFFIRKAVLQIPPMLLGSIRFLAAGFLLMGWSLLKGESIGTWQQIKPAIISGLLLLLIGNGAVIWAEKTLPSSLVAVLVSSSPLWFVLLDKPKWKENLTNRSVLTGLVIGFAGVILLFSENVSQAFSSPGGNTAITGLVVILIGSISWAGGSLYSKYNSKTTAVTSSAWQMLAAGIAFIPGTFLQHEWNGFEWKAVTMGAWLSVVYLIIMGSLVGYSAYVWLLQVRTATQVSTHAYVNPVVAVLLGVFFANEHMGTRQIIGLVIILTSVLLINLSRYRTIQKKIDLNGGVKDVVAEIGNENKGEKLRPVV
jgi:drug/metabolite transporter (DMT)-like permease